MKTSHKFFFSHKRHKNRKGVASAICWVTLVLFTAVPVFAQTNRLTSQVPLTLTMQPGDSFLVVTGNQASGFSTRQIPAASMQSALGLGTGGNASFATNAGTAANLSGSIALAQVSGTGTAAAVSTNTLVQMAVGAVGVANGNGINLTNIPNTALQQAPLTNYVQIQASVINQMQSYLGNSLYYNGIFNGVFNGNASGATNVPAASLVGTVPTTSLPLVRPIAGATMLNTELSQSLSISNATVRVNIAPCNNVYDPQILLTGWGLNYQSPTVLPGATWYVNAAIEYPSNTFYPLFAGGNSNIMVQSGATVITDPTIFLDIPKGATNAWVREWWWTTNGNQTFQVGYVPNTVNGIGNFGGPLAAGEWFYGNTSGGSQVAGGNNAPNYTYGISPQILGYSTTNTSIGIIGDSVAQAPNGACWQIHRSYLAEGLYGSTPFINAAETGSTFESWEQNPQAMALLSHYCHTIICQLGVNNDGQSLSYLTNLVVPFWQDFQRRGCHVVQTTMTPHASSTNGFVTEAGQTAINLNTHTNFNAWLRTQTYVPVLDIATNIESVSNPGCWRLIGGTNTTIDGLHPETAIAVWTLATCVSNNLSMFK